MYDRHKTYDKSDPCFPLQELMGEFGVQTLCPVSNCGHTSDTGTTWIEHIGQLTLLILTHIHTYLQNLGKPSFKKYRNFMK